MHNIIDDINSRLSAWDWRCCGDKIYAALKDVNQIIAINKENYDNTNIGECYDEEITKQNLFGSIVYNAPYLCFIPVTSKDALILNVDNQEIEAIRIIENNSTDYGDWLFSQGIVYDRKLYLIGFNYPGIVRVDRIGENPFCKDILLYRNINELQGDEYIGMGKYSNNDYTYFPLCHADGVLKADFCHEKFEYIKVQSGLNGFFGLYGEKDYIWMTTYGDMGGVYKWSISSGYGEFIKTIDECEIYLPPISVGNDIYLIPRHGKHAFVIDKCSNEVRICKGISDILQEITGNCMVLWASLIEDSLLFQVDNNRLIYEYSIITGYVDIKEMIINKTLQSRIIDDYFNSHRSDVFNEIDLSLTEFIKRI